MDRPCTLAAALSRNQKLQPTSQSASLGRKPAPEGGRERLHRTEWQVRFGSGIKNSLISESSSGVNSAKPTSDGKLRFSLAASLWTPPAFHISRTHFCFQIWQHAVCLSLCCISKHFSKSCGRHGLLPPWDSLHPWMLGSWLQADLN